MKFVYLLLLTWCWSSAQAFDTAQLIWEAQWQQSGYPMNARKWSLSTERKITYSINEQASSSAAQEIRKALLAVGQEANIEFLVHEGDAKAAQMQFSVSRYSDAQLRTSPCHASPVESNFMLTQVRFSISEQQAYRCVLHELMHGMGFMGHPSGDTVLSYFEGNQSGLKEIDKFLLKHWNSPLITTGMSIFRTTELLADLWIAEKVSSDAQAAARQSRRDWFQKTVAQMDAFADGQGEVPTILYRSGRLSDSGVKTSRNVIQGILGVAHLEGYGTPRNPTRARDLIWRGTQNQMPGARTALVRGLTLHRFEGVDMSEVCAWIKNTPLNESKFSAAQQESALGSRACTSRP